MSAASLAERQQAISLIAAYGQLLTKTQLRMVESYYSYDLSLAEIAEESGVTRAAVSEAIKNAVSKMEEFENKLGLLSKKEKYVTRLSEIRKISDPSMRLKAYDDYVEENKDGI
ncbi:MAG: hypothetical protein J6328_06080 [Bacilli bacterium]|nr:hypothetical protein [Bacilli bacterium]